MTMLLIASLIAAAISAPIAAPLPLTSDQSARLRCVAGLAIIANEQSRGVGGWEDVQNLANKGAKFAAVVGDDLVKNSGRNRDIVRGDMFAAVASLQKEASGADQDDNLLRELVQPCVAMMEAALPSPSLQTCAVMLSLAYDEVYSREGLSKTAKDLATFAAVLDSRARDELRAKGKSEAESDIAMGIAKALAKRDRGEFDFEACFELARP